MPESLFRLPGLFRETFILINKFYKTIFKVMCPSCFAAIITFALGVKALMYKIHLRFPVFIDKCPDNFGIFPLLFIIYPMQVAVGYQPNNFFTGDKFGNFKIYKGVFRPSKIYGEFII